MCIVIDTNCLNRVFDTENPEHDEYKPIYDWIYSGKGKILYGGSKYLKELNKYLKLFKEFKTIGKAIYVDCNLVDKETRKVSSLVQHNDFDDQHLVGLLKVSKCKLICSMDSRAYQFFQSSTFFSPASSRPKIYKSSRQANLLCDSNISDICKPCRAIKNKEKKLLPKI